MTKQVQIILPVLNRLELTRQTIRSLLDNTDHKLFDLFILNDGSDPSTTQYLYSVEKNWPDTVFLMSNKVPVGPGAARNELIKYLTDTNHRGKYLYSSDNDVYFKTGWLERLVYLYEKANQTIYSPNRLALLGASCHPFLQDNAGGCYLQYPEVTEEPQTYRIGLKDAVSGYSQLMSWKIWDKFGPFDEGSRGLEEKTGRSEDWALCRKMVDAGFFVGSVTPELIVPCGKTNTYGKPAIGQETFKEVDGVKVL